MAKNITPRSNDYSQWYHDVISAGKLADYAPIKGCMVIRPTGYAIWESIQATLDRKFKETGHVNAYFPLLIPQRFMEKEAEHVEGFSPECAVVTHGGGKELDEPLMIRPTSETVIGHMYSNWVKSYRDLPVLINQWCNVMRWEMRTRLFLRTSEFLWQEGHTAHETAEQAQEETLKMLEIYRNFQEEYLAIPVIAGKKSEHEKFPGALSTYTIEGMMQDKKALQISTSHNLGQNFAKAFEIQFLNKNNQQQLVHTTSWGCSTRMIGGLIMAHSDDDGLILPPKIAPIKVVIVPIFKTDGQKEALLAFSNKIKQSLSEKLDILDIKVDERDNLRPSDKFFHWIQQGIPLRIEVGPKDLEQNSCLLVRRDNREKTKCAFDKITSTAIGLLERIQSDLFAKAKAYQIENTHSVDSYGAFKDVIKNKGGFIKAHWNGTKEVELQIKKETKATLRVIPFDEDASAGKCIVTGEPSEQQVVFAIAY